MSTAEEQCGIAVAGALTVAVVLVSGQASALQGVSNDQS
jgi:hypothetical protein